MTQYNQSATRTTFYLFTLMALFHVCSAVPVTTATDCNGNGNNTSPSSNEALIQMRNGIGVLTKVYVSACSAICIVYMLVIDITSQVWGWGNTSALHCTARVTRTNWKNASWFNVPGFSKVWLLWVCYYYCQALPDSLCSEAADNLYHMLCRSKQTNVEWNEHVMWLRHISLFSILFTINREESYCLPYTKISNLTTILLLIQQPSLRHLVLCAVLRMPKTVSVCLRQGLVNNLMEMSVCCCTSQTVSWKTLVFGYVSNPNLDMIVVHLKWRCPVLRTSLQLHP